ncbi:unnamed protein product [Rotaria magnacalcarata]|uniref:Uncharacterized protein n=5 Tax=Rotaria magnacalcarata TaxID=392030 RepID=A0A819T572_9BILA|nr:unnamed protein product [Rotaria magnacalcarata]
MKNPVLYTFLFTVILSTAVIFGIATLVMGAGYNILYSLLFMGLMILKLSCHKDAARNRTPSKESLAMESAKYSTRSPPCIWKWESFWDGENRSGFYARLSKKKGLVIHIETALDSHSRNEMHQTTVVIPEPASFVPQESREPPPPSYNEILRIVGLRSAIMAYSVTINTTNQSSFLNGTINDIYDRLPEVLEVFNKQSIVFRVNHLWNALLTAHAQEMTAEMIVMGDSDFRATTSSGANDDETASDILSIKVDIVALSCLIIADHSTVINSLKDIVQLSSTCRILRHVLWSRQSALWICLIHLKFHSSIFCQPMRALFDQDEDEDESIAENNRFSQRLLFNIEAYEVLHEQFPNPEQCRTWHVRFTLAEKEKRGVFAWRRFIFPSSIPLLNCPVPLSSKLFHYRRCLSFGDMSYRNNTMSKDERRSMKIDNDGGVSITRSYDSPMAPLMTYLFCDKIPLWADLLPGRYNLICQM